MIKTIIHHKTEYITTPLKLLLIYFICLMAGQCQDTGTECHSMDIGDYANLSACMPQEISVVPGNVTIGNYSQGADVVTTLSLNGSNVGLHLLYPCEMNGDLTPSGLRSVANAFDPEMGQASYNSTPLEISGLDALFGEAENMTFAIYQPSKETVAIIFFDEGTPYDVQRNFLESLSINVSGQSPQSYCPQSSVGSDLAENNGSRDLFNNSTDEDFMPDTEARLTGEEIAKEAMMEEKQLAENDSLELTQSDMA
jgi:hypothetical protein